MALATPAAPANELTTADLGAFLDGMLPVEMARADIAGMGVAVVKDGQVLLARGYGLADREAGKPVSPDDTLFRIGSISKLFTWMAVMQLVEQDQLDLDADLQRYLDFPLRTPELGPITMRQLMTHRAGFEETIHGLWAGPGEDMSLRDYLTRHQPRRIHAPGQIAAYSNYGATLAAYVVERVSGSSFERYAKQFLLEPLGMMRSSFAQPLPMALRPSMSAGYATGSGQARAFELIRVAPAGAASATVADMARFMVAQLGAKPADGTQPVLKTETLARMQAPQWRHHPLGAALGLGYYESVGYGQRVIGHGGDTAWFHSGMYLLPEHGLGIFVVQNSDGLRPLRELVLRRVLDRYLPAHVEKEVAVPATPETGIAGRYLSSRHMASGPMSMARWFEQTEIRIDDQGILSSSKLRGLNERPLRLRAIGQGVWESEASEAGLARRLYFRKNESNGRWEMSGREAVQVLQQLPWWDDGRLIVPALCAALGIAALGLFSWPLAALVRRHYRVGPAQPALQQARRCTRWASALLLSPWLALGLVALPVVVDISYLSGSVFRIGLTGAQLVAWLMPVALALALRGLHLQWRTAGTWWWARLHALLLVLACLVALLLGWRGELLLGLD